MLVRVDNKYPAPAYDPLRDYAMSETLYVETRE